MIREKVISAPSGILMLLVLIIFVILPIVGFIFVIRGNPDNPPVSPLVLLALLWVADLICFAGLFRVEPNQGVVLTLFGRYVGTVNAQGLRFTNPFYTKKPVSLRVRNFETNHLKVNDKEGNPIEIAAVVVWKVVDTAEALFQVDNYNNYITVQSEAAVRNMATSYPYDSHIEHDLSLRGSTAEIAANLKREIQERLAVAGIEVLEARISHLAYAPEIAAAMLRRQQASAVVAARTKIVEGAVSMVEMALESLAAKGVVQLDGEQRAAMVQNLLVVLCGEQAASPVINAGTLHH